MGGYVNIVSADGKGDLVPFLMQVWPEPGAWYSSDPKQSPFVTLEPRDDVQPDAIVQEGAN